MSRHHFTAHSILLALITSTLPTYADDVDFTGEIQPLLARKCLRCHGQDEENRAAGLRLDDRQHAVAELESGFAAIVPGDADESELFYRITEEDESLRMPPPGEGEPFDEREVAAIRRWIDQGAPYAEHWSFEQPRRWPLPAVSDPAWVSNEIDYFVLARLDAAGLPPSARASRHVLARRLSLDLRGLPPAPDEVRQFVEDRRPDAYLRLVDRMLQDPAYGERWAGVWLDLARYADSRGFGSDPLRMNMWRYRDWVIDALNANLPYDRFTINQLAGDLLPEATLDERMATAFHRNTMTNTEGGTDDEEFRVAAVKDRTETTIRVWMGLTMQCASCHSHKFDPITQEDYYRFFAIFNQTADTDRGDEFPTIEVPTTLDEAQQQRIGEQVAELNRRIVELDKEVRVEQAATPIQPLAGQYVRVEAIGKNRFLSLAEVQVLQGGENLAPDGKARQSSTDYEGPARLAIDGNTDGEYFAAKSTTHTAQQDDPWWEVDLGSAQAVDAIVVWNRTDGGTSSRLVNFRVQLLDASRQAVWQERVGPFPDPNTRLEPRELTAREQEILALRDEIARLEKLRPKMPTLPVMQELPQDQRRTTHMLTRGDFLNPGEEVQPGLLERFPSSREDLALNRLGAAQWLVDPANPLTARVAVNRIWARLFGMGIVDTEEDFGTQGDPPSHPKLLDWLATEYLRLDWDTKQLLRQIVTSETYCQTSRVTPEQLAADPRNRLLSRGARYRLEAETLRDQALALSGLLTRKIGGASVYPYQPPGMWRAAFNGQRTWPASEGADRFRRGLYTFWRRTVPYPSMQTFDAPSREICTVRRIRTNTPLQAFVVLNDPVYLEAAQALARRIVRQGGSSTSERVRFGLELCLARNATPQQCAALEQLYDSEVRHYREHPEAAVQLATEPLGPLPEDLPAAEMASWTVVANVLLNLDGVLTRS
jgi:hypothetical protein